MAVAPSQLRVGIVGCGLIGKRRAEEASAHPSSTLVAVADSNEEVAIETATRFGGVAVPIWKDLIAMAAVDVVVVATPNGMLAEIAIEALAAGKHVLLEKPMGRDISEARRIADAARRHGKLVKVGFNHRYHPALAQAHATVASGELGALINIRARYGHGGRAGYEKEWRGNPILAGGGELTDQGVHIVDLINWFAGVPSEAYCLVQTAVWPIEPLEDNAMGLFRFKSGAIASFHTSWTQWKNLFSFEVFCQNGSVTVAGLGKSYGVERLEIARRLQQGGVPEMQDISFDCPDDSWHLEWDDFLNGIQSSAPYMGNIDDGLSAMEMIDMLYRSAKTNLPALRVG